MAISSVLIFVKRKKSRNLQGVSERKRRPLARGFRERTAWFLDNIVATHPVNSPFDRLGSEPVANRDIGPAYTQETRKQMHDYDGSSC